MKRYPLKLLVAAVWVCLFCVLLFDGQVRTLSFSFCEMHPWLAPVLLILVQAVFSSLALPCSPIAALAGMLWGLKLGFFYSILATLLASAWTFLLGRYVLRGYVATLTIPRPVRAVVSMIEQHRWKAVALAYANPIIPGSSLGYLFGATKISLPAFTVGMLLGTIPLQFALVTCGRLLMNVSLTWLNTVLMATALIAVLLIMRKMYEPGRRLAQAIWSGGR